MFGRLLILFIVVPVLELFLFLYLGSKIGISATLAIIVATAFLGAWLTKSQGLKALHKYQKAIAEGRLPHEEVMDGLMILVAGAVLLTPGFLTDAIGFSLLVPAVRDVVRGFVKAYLAGKIRVVSDPAAAAGAAEAPRPGPRVINVEAEVVEDSAASASGEPRSSSGDGNPGT